MHLLLLLLCLKHRIWSLTSVYGFTLQTSQLAIQSDLPLAYSRVISKCTKSNPSTLVELTGLMSCVQIGSIQTRAAHFNGWMCHSNFTFWLRKRPPQGGYEQSVGCGKGTVMWNRKPNVSGERPILARCNQLIKHFSQAGRRLPHFPLLSNSLFYV